MTLVVRLHYFEHRCHYIPVEMLERKFTEVHKFTKFAAVPKIDNDDPSDPPDTETINGQSGASNHKFHKVRASNASSSEITLRQSGHPGRKLG